MINLDWSGIKQFIVQRSVGLQCVDINGRYYLWAFDGPMYVTCAIEKSDPAGDDQADFEQNYRAYVNASPKAEVTTQYETDDKDLKLAKGKADVGQDGTAAVAIKVPGTFGSRDGRYVAGGYAISEDYNKDDYCTVRVEDKDRIIAMIVAQTLDPNATQPVADQVIQGMGVIPGIGEAFPEYPIVKNYTDSELAPENQGWYFWANALGNTAVPNGECEVEPIGGYGFLPAGFYIIVQYFRPQGTTTGSVRVNFYWGKRE